MIRMLLPIAAAAASLLVTSASATVISFDDLSPGTTVSSQYAALGVVFSPNGFNGAGGPTGNWATNTDLSVVSASGNDVGGLGGPTLLSGNVLRSFNGWLNENGDASFKLSFSTAISSIRMDFGGVSTPSSSRIFAYDGATLLGTSIGSVASGQFTLGFAAASITSVVVTPGDFFDWVGVDNIEFTQIVSAVPEPGTWLMMIFGFGTIGCSFRFQRYRLSAPTAN